MDEDFIYLFFDFFAYACSSFGYRDEEVRATPAKSRQTKPSSRFGSKLKNKLPVLQR